MQFVIYGCVTLYALSLLLTIKEGGNIMGGGLFSLLAPGGYATMMLGVSGAYPVFAYGRWWTVLSAGWLHGSALHILFNMMWVRDLGPPVAEMYGGARMVMIYTILSRDLWIARGARSLWTPRRQQHDPHACDELCRVDVCLWIDHAGHRQLRACRRVRWRISHQRVARSVEARTRQPHRRRAGVPGGDGARDSRLDRVDLPPDVTGHYRE
ncbi:MAG: rhomboid family intramembrane serine protease [Acidobacteria bacterium]|nr:rhomboid family intramembrane serine protease [Acidobacteriota bacterium]